MAEVTVKQLAGVVGTSVERLLDQIKEAGLKASGADAVISDKDKLQLLDYLRGQHGKTAAGGEDRPKKITLKRKSVSELKTGSGPGRGRTVAIEVRKKRTIAKPGDVEEVVKAPEASVKPKELEDLEKLRADQARRELERDQEQERIRARAELRKQESEKEAARIAEAKAPAAVEAEAEAEAEAETQPEAPAKAVKAESEKPRAKKAAGEMATPDVVQAEDARRDKGGKKPARHEKTLHGRTELHVSTDKSGKRKKKKGKYQSRRVVAETRHGFEMPVEPVQHEVNIPETITVDELARRMSMKAGDLIKALMRMGVMATINQVIDQDTAALVVEELGHKVVTINEDDRERELLARDTTQFEEYARAPVVTIMGHVDHGKTSLLDHIRTSKIATGEAGGITQHIGAYHVETDKGMITFLDTPGHAAFTSMRERGANATDVVILVVAADDGVMPQTIEAIQHAKAANVPIIVAVNKVDKEDSDPERVKNELGNYSVISEEWGGENVFVNVSAKTGQGIDDLLDAILLQAELMELKAHSEGPASGVVLEASLDKGRGVTTTVLVQQGTLKKGDIILAGEEFGRVRAMFNEFGKEVEQALPSIPVAVIGLSKTPSAGDEVLVVEDERTAREVTDKRRQKARDLRLAGQQQTKLDSIFDQMKAGEVTKLNILLKADVQGTLEAIREALLKLTADNEEIDVAIVGSGVGGINETDVSLAAASNAIVLGFNVRADASARTSAAERGVDINYYSVIYELIDDVKKALVGLLKPEFREQIIGLAKVQEVFRSQQLGQVAGSLVTEGTIKRSRPIRVLRDNVVIFEGELESLRRYKDDVEEVKSGTECGIAVKNYNDVRPGDQIEVFERVEVERTL